MHYIIISLDVGSHIVHHLRIVLVVRNELPTTSMGVEVITHIITLHLHIIAKLVKARDTNHVTLSIDLPRDGGVL